MLQDLAPTHPRVDAVVVSFCSRDTLRACVEPLTTMPEVAVTVVDNASPDGSADTVADLPLRLARSPHNGGFAYGCNLGAALGAAPYVLFLNPDARIGATDLRRLVQVLDDEPSVGIVAPRIAGDDGHLFASQRRFPDLLTVWGQTLFLHRLWPRAGEMLEEPTRYDAPAEPDWVSGACLLIRRSALELAGGMDEGCFLYCEDTEICRAVRDQGLIVRYEPSAHAMHVGGASAPRSTLLAIHARSRVRYALRSASRLHAFGQIAGILAGELTHAVARARRPGFARGHLQAAREVLRHRRAPSLPPGAGAPLPGPAVAALLRPIPSATEDASLSPS